MGWETEVHSSKVTCPRPCNRPVAEGAIELMSPDSHPLDPYLSLVKGMTHLFNCSVHCFFKCLGLVDEVKVSLWSCSNLSLLKQTAVSGISWGSGDYIFLVKASGSLSSKAGIF